MDAKYTTIKMDPDLHGKAMAAGKLLGDKESFYLFVDKALRERLQHLHAQGKIPAALLPDADQAA